MKLSWVTVTLDIIENCLLYNEQFFSHSYTMSIASQIINYEYFLSMCPVPHVKIHSILPYTEMIAKSLLSAFFYKTWPFFFFLMSVVFQNKLNLKNTDNKGHF